MQVVPYSSWQQRKPCFCPIFLQRRKACLRKRNESSRSWSQSWRCCPVMSKGLKKSCSLQMWALLFCYLSFLEYAWCWEQRNIYDIDRIDNQIQVSPRWSHQIPINERNACCSNVSCPIIWGFPPMAKNITHLFVCELFVADCCIQSHNFSASDLFCIMPWRG